MLKLISEFENFRGYFIVFFFMSFNITIIFTQNLSTYLYRRNRMRAEKSYINTQLITRTFSIYYEYILHLLHKTSKVKINLNSLKNTSFL